MAEVSLRQVSKVYPNGYEAIENLDLEIEDGEFVILVGPSGCGKSTALRMIAGLEDITGGEVRIGGEVVNDIHPRARDIAMIFQNYALYPHMSVAQNIGVALRLAKLPKAQIADEVNRTAKMLDLTEYLDHKPAQLSGGQRQRVAMGRAIVRHPKAFLMDEPLSNLDAKLRVQMRAEIARLQRELGVTTIFVTHDQVEAMTMGDRVAVLDAGVLQQIDTPQTLYDRPNNLFVAGFIGSPAMNLMRATLADGPDGPALRIGSQGVPFALELFSHRSALSQYLGRELIFGIRPEDIGPRSEPEAEPAAVVRSDVTLVESLGAELFVHFKLDATPVVVLDGQAQPTSLERRTDSAGFATYTARFSTGASPQKGQSLALQLDLGNAHFFDPESGLAIR